MISSTGSVASIFAMASAASLWLYPSDTSAAMACALLWVAGVSAAEPAGSSLKGLVVPRRDGQRHPLRLHDAEDGKPHLGTHAGHGGQHLKAGLLLLGGKAVQAYIVLGHAHHGVQGSFLPHTGQCPRHAGRALGIVAHAAAAEHHGIQAFFHDFSSQTVDHRILSVKTRRPAGRLWYAVRWVPPPGGCSG